MVQSSLGNFLGIILLLEIIEGRRDVVRLDVDYWDILPCAG